MFIMYLCYHMIRLILIGTLGPIYTSSTSIFILILLLLETLQYEYAAMNVDRQWIIIYSIINN